jgi:multidrug efflux pump subunit AcrB
MVISDLAIRKRIPVFILMAIFIFTGTFAYLTIPREAAPDLEIPYIIITTPYRGVSPADIESTITIPMEQELKGLPKVKQMRSTSAEGASMIMIEFETSVTNEEALRKVKDRVDKAKSKLPPEADEPIVTDINISEFPVMIINISGRLSENRERNLIALKAIADKAKDVIVGFPGVLDAQVVGGLVPEVRIELDPDKLAAYRMPAALLVSRYIGEDVDISAGSAGMGKIKYDIRVPMEFERNIKAAEKIVVLNSDTKALYLSDLAVIVPGFQEESSFARTNGEESVSILVQKQAGKNLLIMAGYIKYFLNEASKTGVIPPSISTGITNDNSRFVELMVEDLNNNIVTGLILVLAVLLVSLGLRNAFFVALAIPFSLFITFTLMGWAGITMNMIVMFSLILVLGMLVDDGVVIVENIFRHRQEGYGPIEASMRATDEVAWPVITSTLTTIAAFLPLLFWPGIMGSFLWFLPFTVIVALSASLFVAMVINPMLCAYYMSVKKEKIFKDGVRPVKGFMVFYRGLLRTAVKFKIVTVLGSFALLAVIVALYFRFGAGVEFMPSSDPKFINISIKLPEGARVQATDEVVREVENIVREADCGNDINYMVSSVGSGGMGGFNPTTGTTPYLAQIAIELKDIDKRKYPSPEFLNKIRERTSKFAGVIIDVAQRSMGPPTGAEINVELAGDDYELLGVYTGKALDIIRNTDGAVNVRDDLERGRPQLKVEVDRRRAALLGLSPLEVGTTIKTAYRGAKVGVFRIDEKEYEINVIANKQYREGFGLLDKLYISTRTGLQVPASTVASWKVEGSPGVIRRVNQKRVVTITGNAAVGYSAAEVRQKIEKRLDADLSPMLPEGYNYKMTGENEHQAEASSFLSQAFVIAILLVWFVLIAQFNSIKLPAIIMMTVILSLVGVFLGLLISDYRFGIIMTGIGVISLVGVVVKNGIVLIDYIQKLRYRGYTVGNALVQGGMTRLRPVLLTAVATILGLVPMATKLSYNFNTLEWNYNTEMAQWWGAMANAVIFGLTFATILTLVVVPSTFYLFHSTGYFSRRYLRRNGISPEGFARFVSSIGVFDPDMIEQCVKVARERGAPAHKAIGEHSEIGPKKFLSLLSDFTGHPIWADVSTAGEVPRFTAAFTKKNALDMKIAAFCSYAKVDMFGIKNLSTRPCTPFDKGANIYLAVSDPLDAKFAEYLHAVNSALTGMKFKIVLVSEENILSLIENIYSSGKWGK